MFNYSSLPTRGSASYLQTAQAQQDPLEYLTKYLTETEMANLDFFRKSFLSEPEIRDFITKNNLSGEDIKKLENHHMYLLRDRLSTVSLKPNTYYYNYHKVYLKAFMAEYGENWAKELANMNFSETFSLYSEAVRNFIITGDLSIALVRKFDDYQCDLINNDKLMELFRLQKWNIKEVLTLKEPQVSNLLDPVIKKALIAQTKENSSAQPLSLKQALVFAEKYKQSLISATPATTFSQSQGPQLFAPPRQQLPGVGSSSSSTTQAPAPAPK